MCIQDDTRCVIAVLSQGWGDVQQALGYPPLGAVVTVSEIQCAISFAVEMSVKRMNPRVDWAWMNYQCLDADWQVVLVVYHEMRSRSLKLVTQ